MKIGFTNEQNLIKRLFSYDKNKIITEQTQRAGEDAKFNKLAGEVLANAAIGNPAFISPLFPGAIVTGYLNPITPTKNGFTILYKIFFDINAQNGLITREDKSATFLQSGTQQTFVKEQSAPGAIDFKSLNLQQLLELYKSGKVYVGSTITLRETMVGMSNPLFFMSGQDKQTNDSVIKAFNVLKKINPDAANLVIQDYWKDRDTTKINWFKGLVTPNTNAQPAQPLTAQANIKK